MNNPYKILQTVAESIMHNIELIPKRSHESDAESLPVRGAHLLQEPYANIFLCARKKSGKTTVLYNILKHCVGENTKVICFASTVYKDAQWLRINDYLKKRHITFERHISMYDDRTGVNRLEVIMSDLQQSAKSDIAKEEAKEREKERRKKAAKDAKAENGRKKKVANKKRKRDGALWHGIGISYEMDLAVKHALHSTVKRERLNAPELNALWRKIDVAGGQVQFSDSKSEPYDEVEKELAFAYASYKDRDLDIAEILEEKKRLDDDGLLAPEYIFIFDDLSNELRDPLVAHLLKTNRHYKSKVIVSTQYVKDMKPASRKQVDYWLLFGGHSPDKLEVIFYDADTRLSLTQFINLYKQVTATPYQFLLLDTAQDLYRHGFDPTPINIKSDDSDNVDATFQKAEDEGEKGEEEEECPEI